MEFCLVLDLFFFNIYCKQEIEKRKILYNFETAFVSLSLTRSSKRTKTTKNLSQTPRTPVFYLLVMNCDKK